MKSTTISIFAVASFIAGCCQQPRNESYGKLTVYAAQAASSPDLSSEISINEFDVYIDGKFIGNKSMDITLPVGLRVVEVKYGSNKMERQINIIENNDFQVLEFHFPPEKNLGITK